MAAEGAVGRRVGIEEERFVLADDRAPRPDEFNALVERFARDDALLTDVPTCAGPLLEAALPTPSGPVVVKHDYCTHVLEVAYPPCPSADAFEALHARVWERLTEAARATGLAFTDASHLPALPAGYVFAETDACLARTRRLVARPLPPARHAEPHFLALIAATQVTLEIEPDYYFSTLAAAYSLLYLVPLLHAARRPVRPLVYRDNLPWHPLAGVPAVVPADLEGYRAAVAAIPDRLRDYSFLALRRPGLVEVRVADRRPSARAVTELAALLLAIVRYAGRAPADRDPAATLYGYCETGALPERLSADLAGVEAELGALDPAWRPSRRLLPEAG